MLLQANKQDDLLEDQLVFLAADHNLYGATGPSLGRLVSFGGLLQLEPMGDERLDIDQTG